MDKSIADYCSCMNALAQGVPPASFEDSKGCLQTYDPGHSVSNIPPIVCPAPGTKAKAPAPAPKEEAKEAKEGAKPKDPAVEKEKDAKDAAASEKKAVETKKKAGDKAAGKPAKKEDAPSPKAPPKEEAV